MEFNENSKRRVYSIDLDGTLCTGAFWEGEPQPRQDVIDAVKNLCKSGNIIIIWTARQWNCAPETVGWLIKYQVPFHGLYMAKGGSDFYVDDKNVTIESILT